jgi:hypothetical protein
MKDLEIESIGKLTPHPAVPDEWFISKPIPISFFDNKELQFIIEGDFENDKNFLFEANRAIRNFLKKDSIEKFNYTNSIFENYQEYLKYFDEDLLKLKDKSEIWNYVYPSVIHLNRRNWRDRDVYLQICCECEWEVEHGLQLVFRQGSKLTRVSAQDGHLTEADAYDKPDSGDKLLSEF